MTDRRRPATEPESIEAWVERQAAKVPPPTPEQLDEVRRLLAPRDKRS